MWFKNLVVYRLPADWSLSPAEFEEQLARRPLQPCMGYDMQTRGWVAPAHHERLLHSLNRHHLFALGVNRKVLPASVINQTTKERALELVAEQGYPVGRRQMRELKQNVADELRARAFTRRSVVRAWLNPDRGWLIVDSASFGKAEELIETLRETLGSCAVTPLETTRAPAASMGAWLTFGNAPGGFNIETDLELQAVDEQKSTVRYVRHSLEGKDIRDHVTGGKTALRLGLSWKGRVAFILNSEYQIKRVQFLDIVTDKAEGEGQAAEEQFDIDFALMTGEVSQMLVELIEALGGEECAGAGSAAELTSPQRLSA